MCILGLYILTRWGAAVDLMAGRLPGSFEIAKLLMQQADTLSMCTQEAEKLDIGFCAFDGSGGQINFGVEDALGQYWICCFFQEMYVLGSDFMEKNSKLINWAV